MSHLRKRVRIGVVFLLVLMATVVVAGAQANPTAGDPYYTNCYLSSVGLKQITLYDPANHANMGVAILKYSKTCKTEWVSVYYNSGYFPSPSVWVQNQTGTNLYTSGGAPYQGTVWTEMLPSMQYRVGCGGVQMYHTYNAYYPTQGKYIGWYYIGCA
jgi:hypothetical protein